MEQLQLSHTKIEQLAYRDSLTGLPNRRMFLELVERSIRQSQKADCRCAILFLDLDDFKRVNDTLGHEAGDALLKEVANRLNQCMRRDDQGPVGQVNANTVLGAGAVARLGGDEFIVLVTNLRAARDAMCVAERILASLRQPFLLKDQEFVIGTSIGIASFPDNGMEVESLIECADTAMYEAKRHGKNSYRFYGNDMQFAVQERFNMERDLRLAVDSLAFELHFQPQYETQTRRRPGAYAALRCCFDGVIPLGVTYPLISSFR